MISLWGVIAAPPPDFAFGQNYPQNIVVNNRILLKIDGKAVTIMDVVRKMDLLFYRQYPDLASSAMARYQFYTSGWRSVLGAVIDDYLIVADAEEKEITINDGEVREELEKMFGPDVVLNLDQLGMTLEEAFDLLKTELTVQRMTAIMVRSKAITDVHPLSVRKKYQELLSENPSKNYWVYQVLSIRGPEHEGVAREAYRLISEQRIPFEEVAQQVKQEGLDLTYSDEYRQHEGEISLAYRAVLESLSVGVASPPLSNKMVSRLFCLKGIEKEEPRSFHTVEDELKSELIQEAISRHNIEYRGKLREHYGLTEKYLNSIIPETLQPFALR